MNISNSDLYANLYDLTMLKNNIYALSLVDIVKTQRLTPEFCVKYILNNAFQLTEEEENITIKDIMQYQTHISYEELVVLQVKMKKSLIKNDSFEDFESFANRN
jgi:hypothetical protein